MNQLKEKASDYLIESGGNKFVAINRLIQSGAEKKAAIQAVNDAYREIDTLTEKGDILFSDFLAIWILDSKAKNWKQSTAESNEKTIGKNFQSLYEISLNEISREIVDQWITSLCKKELSPKTIKNNYALLHAALETAVEWEYISSNPAEGVKLPKGERHETSCFNKKEVKVLTKAILSMPDREQDYKVGLLLGLFGGLRKGEICGLNEDDVDIPGRMISVKRSRMVGRDGVYEDTLKTYSSFRTISLPDEVMDEIESLIQQHRLRKSDKEWQQSAALLRNKKGRPIYPKMIYKRYKRLLKDNGLPDLSLHSLRHTHVSMLIESGANIEDVKSRVGHTCNATTLNIYTHLFHSADEHLARKISELYLKEQLGS